MLFDRVLDNLRSDKRLPIDDNLDLPWSDCLRRASGQTTRTGHRVRLVLPLGVRLRDGDVVTNGTTRLAIHIMPCDVLLIRPADSRQAAMIGLGLGNLHAPVQCADEYLVTLPDGPIEQLLVQLGAKFERRRHRFEPETLVTPLQAQLAADFQIWPASGANAARARVALAVAEGSS